MPHKFEEWKDSLGDSLQDYSKEQAMIAAWNAGMESASAKFKEEMTALGVGLSVNGYVQGLEMVMQVCADTRKALLDRHKGIPTDEPV